MVTYSKIWMNTVGQQPTKGNVGMPYFFSAQCLWRKSLRSDQQESEESK